MVAAAAPACLVGRFVDDDLAAFSRKRQRCRKSGETGAENMDSARQTGQPIIARRARVAFAAFDIFTVAVGSAKPRASSLSR